MDDCLAHSATLEQHLHDVREVLEIFRCQKIYCKLSKWEFGIKELGFFGHSLSAAGVSVDPCKVHSLTEWSTPTSCAWRLYASQAWQTTTAALSRATAVGGGAGPSCASSWSISSTAGGSRPRLLAAERDHTPGGGAAAAHNHPPRRDLGIQVLHQTGTRQQLSSTAQCGSGCRTGGRRLSSHSLARSWSLSGFRASPPCSCAS